MADQIVWKIGVTPEGGDIARGYGEYVHGVRDFFVEIMWDEGGPGSYSGYAYWDTNDSGELNGDTLAEAITEYEGMVPDQIEVLKKAAQEASGLNYESVKAKAIIGKEDWQGYYPEVDAWGKLTGYVIDIDDVAYIVIEDLVMINKWELDADELSKLREGYFPVRD